MVLRDSLGNPEIHSETEPARAREEHVTQLNTGRFVGTYSDPSSVFLGYFRVESHF